jgi:hypothetical protein
VMKNLKKRASSYEDRFPKSLFALSCCKIAEDDSSGDLLFRSRMHVGERDEVALMVQQWRRQKPRCVGGSWLFVVSCSIAAACIYRKDLPKVTTSRNRLGLSLSKRIIHSLVAKINDKRRLRTCEALGQISADYSHARRAPAPIALPHLALPCHATPSLTWRGEVIERAHVFLSFSSPSHTSKCIESNPPFK